LALAVESLAARGIQSDEDALAYFRDDAQFFNLLLVEQPNDDFAMTVAKLFLYDAYHQLRLKRLTTFDDAIAAVAEKALVEVEYHRQFSAHWLRVLRDGTEESAQRMRNALAYLWPLCGEFFTAADFEQAMQPPPDCAQLKDAWLATVMPAVQPLELALDEALAFAQPLGKHNRHSEHLGFLLAEMQVLARQHPGARW